MKFNFCGPSYKNRALTADAQTCMNLYAEVLATESPVAKAKIILHATPGLETFCELPEGPVRAIFTDSHLRPSTDRVFAVSGPSLYEIFSDKTFTLRGAVANDKQPAYIASSGVELGIASFNQFYLMNLATNAFSGPIEDVNLNSVRFADGYFLGNRPGTQVFQISALFDGSSWDALDFSSAEGAPDNIVAILTRPNDVLFFGSRTIQPFVNTGNADFPYEPIPGAWLKIGVIAPASVAELHGIPFWLGSSEEGAGIAYAMMRGYQADRISDLAVENEWQQYQNFQDAIGWTYQDSGHSFWILYFQEANKTWAYDMSTDMWHERGCWDQQRGQFNAHRARVHAYGFGKHLVGSR